MPKICIELIATECKTCINVENCIRVEALLRTLQDECQVDVERVILVDRGKILEPSNEICRDLEVKAIRVAMGGGRLS